jgi:hypothetical protein
MFRLMAVVLGALALGGCSNECSGSSCVKGSGKVVSQNRQVGDFTGIRLDSIGHLTVEQTGTNSVTVETDDNLQPIVTSIVKDGTLVLSESGCHDCSPTKIDFTVTVKSMQAIDLPSTGSAVVTKLDGPKLSVKLPGTGSIQLSGRVGDLNISASGTGACNAEQLTAKNATVVLSGTGNVRVNAADSLDAKLTGTGSILYLGSPKLTQSNTGTGKIQPDTH